nr:minor capsid protein [Tumebacillus amylolyticus]
MKVKLADLPTIDFGTGEDFTPQQAIAILKDRALTLAGVVEADIVAAVKKLCISYLAGTPRPKVEEEIAKIRKFNESRASLITTTETTYAYNRARLVSYKENSVDYVQFSAIMDSRTSQVCSSRHGLVMAMDDPRLGQNTPPLHGRCRSVLMPLYSRYEPKEVTPERLDWGGVTALPKGWKTG